MPAPKGYQVTTSLRTRAAQSRGGLPLEDFPSGAAQSLAERAKVYLQTLAMRHYSPDTLKARRDYLKNFLLWASDRDLIDPDQITKPILESYQRHLYARRKANGKPLGISTQRLYLSVIKDYFGWLTRENYLQANPASELVLPRRQSRLPEEVLDAKQLRALFTLPDTSDPLGVRDRTMLELFYSTGMRRSELARLEVGDLNPERQTVQIRQGKGRKDRVVPVGERALQWLERYLAQVRPKLLLDTREQGLFLTSYGEPFHPGALSHLVSKMMTQIGRKGSCHLLRHTCATHMLEGGADIRFIQQLLGHAKLDTTAIYTQVTIEQLKEVHRRCHPCAQN